MYMYIHIIHEEGNEFFKRDSGYSASKTTPRVIKACQYHIYTDTYVQIYVQL